MQDAADHSPIVDPFLATHVRRQQRGNPLPLIVTQPKQVPSHLLCSLTTENQQPILPSTLFMGF
jgi:hypothetical protein